MDGRDLDLARQIAVNSGDIRDMMERLIDDNESLGAELGQAKAEPGADYHLLAMRTAAGPEVFHRAMIPEVVLHINDSRRLQFAGQAAIRAVLADFIYAARALSAIKASLFYGKEFEAPDPHVASKMVDDSFNTDLFDNYQTLHAILGICSESGELLEDVVQLVLIPAAADCDEDDLPKRADAKDKIVANMRRELGDIDWFQELLAASSHPSKRKFTIDDCRAGNIGRLRIRFPDKFSGDAAMLRADEGFDFDQSGYAEVIEAPAHPGAELGMPAPGEEVVDAEFTEVEENKQ